MKINCGYYQMGKGHYTEPMNKPVPAHFNKENVHAAQLSNNRGTAKAKGE
jgi:hypothetical protein